MSDLAERIERIEAQLEIGQLPIRYAMAVDARDIDTWLSLFIPNVQVGRDKFGREALRGYIEPALRSFKRSLHQICGHRIEILDRDNARGATYCRAEHEVDDRWIVMGICYFDTYQRVDGTWYFSRRQEKHWYSADINEHPQAVAFDSWKHQTPALPDRFETWAPFWANDAQS
ncbi:MAG: nuclear transport factor 2 family protein [Acidimicrobiia bacterium]